MIFLNYFSSFVASNALERVLKGKIKHSFLEIFFFLNILLKIDHSLGKVDFLLSKKFIAISIKLLTLSVDLLIDFLDNKLTEA